MRKVFLALALLGLTAGTALADVPVEVKNSTWAVKVKWKTEKASGEFVQRGTVPAGEVTLTATPFDGNGWYQIALFLVDDKIIGGGLSPVKIALKEGDHVAIHALQPVPPWNAVMIRVRGEWVMLTLIRPWAAFQAGPNEFKGPEKEPNSAIAWARYGTQKMAEELADNFLAKRNNKGHWGGFRGTRHTALTVPTRDVDHVAPPFDRIGRDELVKELVSAFELLLRQRPPLGPSIKEEVAAAKKAAVDH